MSTGFLYLIHSLYQILYVLFLFTVPNSNDDLANPLYNTLIFRIVFNYIVIKIMANAI